MYMHTTSPHPVYTLEQNLNFSSVDAGICCCLEHEKTLVYHNHIICLGSKGLPKLKFFFHTHCIMEIITQITRIS